MCSRKPSILRAFLCKKMNTQQENWKAVADSNGIYYISSHGRVKSFKFGKERILKPGLVGKLGNRYLAVFIKKSIKVHRLVALAFVPNMDNKPQVNHIDGNKLNNSANNLEWATARENIKHAWDTGLNESKRLAISKPVIDIVTNKKYSSLIAACMEINEPYNLHKLRNFKKSKRQRFFYIQHNGNGQKIISTVL